MCGLGRGRYHNFWLGGAMCIALLIGTMVRIAALPMAGSYDVLKGWSYVAATRGEAYLYHWASAPRDLTLRRVDGFDAHGDYPPLSLYWIGAVGRVYQRASGGRFPDSDALTALLKVPALLAEAALTFLLFVVVRRASGIAAARLVVLLVWLNPAMILTTSVFGYTDVLFVLPAVGALIAGLAGRPALAGGLIAAAVLTKPQPIVIAPAVALAVWHLGESNRRSAFRAAVTGLAVTSLVILAPIIAAGATLDMTRAVGSLVLGKDLLSNAFNLWWVAGHFGRPAQIPGVDLPAMLTSRADIVPISAFSDFGSIAVRVVVRVVGLVPVVAAIGWGIWTVRRTRELWLLAAAAAFFVEAYALLATQVHENHVFAAVPLLALAAAGRRQFLPILIAVSAIYALNLNILYGLGEGMNEDVLRYALPGTLAGVDLTIVLALANCLTLAWHAVLLRRECDSITAAQARATTPQPRSQPAW
jgi:hypothetical protein